MPKRELYQFAVPDCPCASARPSPKRLPEWTLWRCPRCAQWWESRPHPGVWGSARGWAKVGEHVALRDACRAMGVAD